MRGGAVATARSATFTPPWRKPDINDIKEATKKVTDGGGKELGEPVEIPDVGHYVSFIDTEGNRVVMLQSILA